MASVDTVASKKRKRLVFQMSKSTVPHKIGSTTERSICHLVDLKLIEKPVACHDTFI